MHLYVHGAGSSISIRKRTFAPAGRCAADMEYSVGFDRDGIISALDVAVYMQNGMAIDTGIVDFVCWKSAAEQVRF